jgi:hypothetical protein
MSETKFHTHTKRYWQLHKASKLQGRYLYEWIAKRHPPQLRQWRNVLRNLLSIGGFKLPMSCYWRTVMLFVSWKVALCLDWRPTWLMPLEVKNTVDARTDQTCLFNSHNAAETLATRRIPKYLFFETPFSIVALGSTQPLTEMSTRNLPGVKGRPARKVDNLTRICVPIV